MILPSEKVALQKKRASRYSLPGKVQDSSIAFGVDHALGNYFQYWSNPNDPEVDEDRLKQHEIVALLKKYGKPSPDLDKAVSAYMMDIDPGQAGLRGLRASEVLLLPSELRKAKFPKGETMTVDEVAAVVGPEFKEMNENPPPEVVKVMEEMQKKGSPELLPSERALAARFHEGPPGTKEFEDWEEDQPQEFQKDWDENTDKYKDKFKEARLVWATLPRIAGLDDFDQEILGSLFHLTEIGDVPITIPDLMRTMGWPKTYQKGFVSKLRELASKGLVEQSPKGYSAKLASVRRARFEEGPQGAKDWAAWIKKQPKEVQEDWDKYTEENKDKFKEAADAKRKPDMEAIKKIDGVLSVKMTPKREIVVVVDDNIGNSASKVLTDKIAPILDQWEYDDSGFYRSSDDIPKGKKNQFIYTRKKTAGLGGFALLEEAMYAKGEDVPLEDLPQELQDNVNDPPPAVQKLKDELQGGGEEAMFDKEGPALPIEQLASESRVRSTWEKEAASGLYGYTRAIQTDVEATIRKAQKKAAILARTIYAKDENVVPFLLKHAKRANSMPAKLLLAAMKDLGPKIPEKTASESPSRSDYSELAKSVPAAKWKDFCEAVSHAFLHGRANDSDKLLAALKKEGYNLSADSGDDLGELARSLESSSKRASADKTSGLGMYGLPAKTARLGLSACSELRAYVGEAAADLHQRRVAGYPHITGFLKQHHKEAKCEYSRLILGCYPDPEEEAPSKKTASVSLRDDFPTLASLIPAAKWKKFEQAVEGAYNRGAAGNLGRLTQSLADDGYFEGEITSKAETELTKLLQKMKTASSMDLVKLASGEVLTGGTLIWEE